MTAEITIMNKSAVVLAADSAVTVGKDRIYKSANKLFTLSKVHPVGIMIYSNADFMGVPWESIIKIYRRNLGKKEFKTLEEYARDFLHYLESDRMLFPEEIQLKLYREFSKGYLSYIRELIRNKFEDEKIKSLEDSIQSGKEAKKVEEKKIFSDVIKKEWEDKNNLGILPNLKALKADSILTKHNKVLDELLNREFEKAPLNNTLRKKLKEILINNFLNDRFISYTGVVIAGFGSDEVFPSHCDFFIESIFENKLKHSELSISSAKSGASIQFFAQSDKGTSFIRGIDPDLLAYSKIKFNEFNQNLEQKLLKSLSKQIKKSSSKKVEKSVKALILGEAKEYNKNIVNYIEERSVRPIVNTVSSLPKDELASVAEILVNLTSFKKRVSGELETVGGPIDVAIISKGDGFIWIKRKHYFEPQLNPHFLETYFQEIDNGQKTTARK